MSLARNQQHSVATLKLENSPRIGETSAPYVLNNKYGPWFICVNGEKYVNLPKDYIREVWDSPLFYLKASVPF